MFRTVLPILSKLKTFYSLKGTINKIKRKARDWEKIFAIQISHRENLLRLCKEFLLNNKMNKPIRKKGKQFYYPFPEKIYGWQKTTQKVAQHHLVLRK